jgi:hydrogenase small subunit
MVPYGAFIRRARSITNHSLNEEPKFRHNRPVLTTGMDPRWGQRGQKTT